MENDIRDMDQEIETEDRTPMLSVRDLYVNYGLINAIKGVSFDVFEGEIVSLIGANGAGKTTIMHAINGAYPLGKRLDIVFGSRTHQNSPA